MLLENMQKYGNTYEITVPTSKFEGCALEPYLTQFKNNLLVLKES